MFLKELLFDYETIVSLIALIVAVIGVYWKMRIDLAKLSLEMEKHNDEMDLKIAAIECDRKEKWKKYEEKQDKQDSYQTDILKGVTEIRVKMEGMVKDIKWLKEK